MFFLLSILSSVSISANPIKDKQSILSTLPLFSVLITMNDQTCLASPVCWQLHRLNWHKIKFVGSWSSLTSGHFALTALFSVPTPQGKPGKWWKLIPHRECCVVYCINFLKLIERCASLTILYSGAVPAVKIDPLSIFSSFSFRF